jgi:hypothetical protein
MVSKEFKVATFYHQLFKISNGKIETEKGVIKGHEILLRCQTRN